MSNELILYIAGIVLGLLAGIVLGNEIGKELTTNIMKVNIIKHQCGEYNLTTGEFQWKKELK